MLYFLRANVTIKVQGISAPYFRTITWLVNAETPNQAKLKYEEQVKKDHAHMQFSGISFEYVEFAGEIK